MDFNIVLAILGLGLSMTTFLIKIIFDTLSRRMDNERVANAETRVNQEPEKVKPAWDLARLTLESYFNKNLNQVSTIFWLSVFVMFIGFGIIIWGISQAIRSPGSALPAIITGLSGIVTEFIGAT